MDKQIIYYYKRGAASYLIAKKFGISNTYVRALLKKNGISLRGHNITNKMSAARRTAEENLQITSAASESNRGSAHTDRHRTKLAISREKNPKIDPVYEKPLVEYLNKRKIEVIPQKAFYKYNVDLYLTQYNVVIEIFGGSFHNKKDAVVQFQNKMNYLSRNNIKVLVVWSDKNNYLVDKITEVAINVKDKLTIINGDGSYTVKGLTDIVVNY